MSKKKHVHRWGEWHICEAGPHKGQVVRYCKDLCEHDGFGAVSAEGVMSMPDAIRILNAWERRPKYRKAGWVVNVLPLGVELSTDTKQGDTLYVKVSRQ